MIISLSDTDHSSSIESHPISIDHSDQPVRSRVQVIDRAAHLMAILSSADEPASLKHLSTMTGLHTATAHRILASLCINGLVERADNHKYYRLGMKMARASRNEQTHQQLAKIAGERLRNFSEEAACTVRLLYRKNYSLLCSEQFQDGVAVPNAAATCPLHCNPVGKLWLGHLGETFVREYVRATEPGPPNIQESTFTRLWSQATSVVVRGFALERMDPTRDTVTVGILVRDNDYKPVAALTLSNKQSLIEPQAVGILHEISRYISERAFGAADNSTT